MFSPNAIFLANHSNMNYLTKKAIYFNLHFLKKSGSIFFTFTLLEKERKLLFFTFHFSNFPNHHNRHHHQLHQG